MKKYLVTIIYAHQTKENGAVSFYVEGLVFSSALRAAIATFSRMTGETQDAIVVFNMEPSED